VFSVRIHNSLFLQSHLNNADYQRLLSYNDNAVHVAGFVFSVLSTVLPNGKVD